MIFRIKGSGEGLHDGSPVRGGMNDATDEGGNIIH